MGHIVEEHVAHQGAIPVTGDFAGDLGQQEPALGSVAVARQRRCWRSLPSKRSLVLGEMVSSLAATPSLQDHSPRVRRRGLAPGTAEVQSAGGDGSDSR